MDILITEEILNVLMIATMFSIILMPLIQKFKRLSIIRNDSHICLLNLFLSFSVGTLFGMSFYDLDLIRGLWVGLFSFIEAPAVYHILKKQNIFNYTPKTLEDKPDVIVVPLENKITREEE